MWTVAPSLTVVSLAPENVTVGATLLTWTLVVAILLRLLEGSPSLTWTLNVVSAGPSAKVHLKLPVLPVIVGEPATRLPPVPQLGVPTNVNVSTPGSVIEKLYVT